MFDDTAIFEWADANESVSLNMGDNDVTLYWYSSSYGDYHTNYKPLEIPVKVEVVKAKAILNDIAWSEENKVTSLTYASDYNGYINTLITNINYTIYYDESNYSTTTEAENLTDAGYYTVVATLPENDYYLYYLKENGDAITTISKQWEIEKTALDLGYYQYNAWSMKAGTKVTSQLDSYYYEEGESAVAKNVTFDITSLNENAQNLLDVSVKHYYLQGEEWEAITNCSAVGQYRSVATLTFKEKEGYKASNYIVNDGLYDTANGIELAVEWNIYPNIYELVTDDVSSANYLGWPENVQTAFVYNGTYQQPELIVPAGLLVYYSWQHVDSNGLVVDNSYGERDIGEYQLSAKLAININLLGYDKVAVEIDCKTYLDGGERITYNGDVEDGRASVADISGIFYHGLDYVNYIIYEENFFAGKTFALSSVTATSLNETEVTTEYLEMAQNLQTTNAGKTAICGENDNTVSGTCDFGGGAFDELTGTDAYTYVDDNGILSISNLEISLVGNMINTNTLRLVANISSDVAFVFIFTLQEE